MVIGGDLVGGPRGQSGRAGNWRPLSWTAGREVGRSFLAVIEGTMVHLAMGRGSDRVEIGQCRSSSSAGGCSGTALSEAAVSNSWIFPFELKASPGSIKCR